MSTDQDTPGARSLTNQDPEVGHDDHLASDAAPANPSQPPPLSASEASQALEADLKARERVFGAALQLKPGAVRLGASNMPHDSSIWALDWREALPGGHPERQRAESDGSLRRPGTPEARAAIQAAHSALVAAARRTHNSGP